MSMTYVFVIYLNQIGCNYKVIINKPTFDILDII